MGGSLLLLTIFFDGQFWYAVAETQDAMGFRVKRWCLGSEPSDDKVVELVERHLVVELDRVLPLGFCPDPPRKMNPKRLQRKVSAEMSKRGPSTMAQEALSRSRELHKQIAVEKARLSKKEDERLRREASVAKKKARHRGR